MNNKKLLSVQNLTVEFNKNKNPLIAVDDITFDIYQGETFGLVGESGSGKTTTGKAIMGIDDLQSGNIFFNDHLVRGNVPSLKKITKEINSNLNLILNSKNKLMELVNDFLKNYKSGSKNSPKLINEIVEVINQNLKELISTISLLDTDKASLALLLTDKQLNKKVLEQYDSSLNKIYDFVMLVKKTMNNIYELFTVNKVKTSEAKLKELVAQIKLVNRIVNSLVDDGKSLKELPNIDREIKQSDIFNKLDKQETKNLKKDMQMIFQDPGSSLNDRMNVQQIISEGLNNYPEIYKDKAVVKEYMKHAKVKSEDVKYSDVKRYLVEQMLAAVGMLPEHMNRYPHEFSGGQKQRIGIARALIMKPKFIIADEPISSLDVSIRAQIINLLNKFKKEYGLTYMFIAHDLTVVRFFADRVGVIYHGKLVELADSEELFKHPLHPYTKTLLNAVPIPNPSKNVNKPIEKYDEAKEHYDYLTDYPMWTEIKPGHYVYMNNRELKELKLK